MGLSPGVAYVPSSEEARGGGWMGLNGIVGLAVGYTDSIARANGFTDIRLNGGVAAGSKAEGITGTTFSATWRFHDSIAKARISITVCCCSPFPLSAAPNAGFRRRGRRLRWLV